MTPQIAETVEDILYWIETTVHYEDVVDHAKRLYVLSGDTDGICLAIPIDLWGETYKLIKAGDKFDMRRFRATDAGLARLQAIGRTPVYD